ncbi:MAG: biosynthetic-type acetolactate synthase large subunit [Chloroflexi bacterium]|mgnify:CR=1 FL=1|nr:biosynthetic-type acetolactate synthase large subunit [Chloroflexota bacterium]
MRMNGAQIIWECLVREGVDTVFGITGGKVIPLYHELPGFPIHHVTMRHEQAAAHAADGYARATGKVGVCVATSGPGATNLVTGIATAQMDSSPIVAITGQVASADLGTDAFQEVDITGITMPITKHNYLVTNVTDLAQALREAFHIARSGHPGAVLVDVTVDAQMGVTEFVYPEDVNLPGYKPHTTGNPRQIAQAAEMINAASRPIIMAGRGVVVAGAGQELTALAEKARIPVVTTLLGKSAIAESNPLYLGMGGMHGEGYTNMALQSADLIVNFGARFDDRFTSTAQTFAPRARVIHVDIDPAEIAKRIRVDMPIVGDALNVLRQLLPLVQEADRGEWMSTIDHWRQETGERSQRWEQSEELVPQHIIRSLSEITHGEAIMVSDVGQNQMWEAQYYTHNRFRGLISSGGLGTMGFGLPASIGAKMGCRDVPVWLVVGDGGIQMTIQELATIRQEGLPIKIALLNNGYLGMVRQWQELFYDKNYCGTPLLGPEFARLAEAYGIAGITVHSKDDVVPALKHAAEVDGPVLIDFRIEQEHNVFPIVPVGRAIDDMIRRPRTDEQPR